MSGGEGVDPTFWPPLRSAIEGVAWPAIVPDGAAHLLALSLQLEQSQWFSPAQLRAGQLRQVRSLLAHAVEQVPYYRRKHYRRWLRGGDATAWDAFAELPILTRRQAQSAGEELRAAVLPPHHGDASPGQTSGSTGMPLRYWSTPLAQAFWNAIVMRDHLWHRRDFSARHAFIRASTETAVAPGWGPPSSALFAAGESAVMSSQRTAAEQLAWLVELAPAYLRAQPVTIRALAQRALTEQISIPALREVRAVAETVTPALRALVRAAWNVPIVDIYSSSECGMLALQCPLTGDYHCQSEAVVIEVIGPDGKVCAPGEIGRIIVTPLHNFAMPLLRYDTGDFAEAGAACACGRGLPTLKRILGRRRNRLFLPDGNTTWPQLSSLPWDVLAPELQRFQLRQQQDLSLLFRYEAPTELPGEREQLIREALLEQLHAALPVRFERVGEIPLSAAGKLEDFASLVDDEAEVRR